MNGLVPRYVYPEFDISMHMNGEISKEDVAKALLRLKKLSHFVKIFSSYFVYSGNIEPSARGFRATITDE